MSNSASAPGPPKNKGRPIKSTREDREQLRIEFLKAVNKTKRGLTEGYTLSVKQLQTLLIANHIHCPVRCLLFSQFGVKKLRNGSVLRTVRCLELFRIELCRRTIV